MYQNDLFTCTTSDQINLEGVKNSGKDSKAVVLIAHGFAEHLGRYDFLTEKL